jgi:hypothetical protein
MDRIHTRSRHTRSRHARRSRNMRSRHFKTKSANKLKTPKRIRHTRKISFGGKDPVSLLPTPYQEVGMVEGASNPQNSAMLAQRNADLQQNETNNTLNGGDGEEDVLPVKQFSGQNNARSNAQVAGLTNILANSRAEAAGDSVVAGN